MKHLKYFVNWTEKHFCNLLLLPSDLSGLLLSPLGSLDVAALGLVDVLFFSVPNSALPR